MGGEERVEPGPGQQFMSELDIERFDDLPVCGTAEDRRCTIAALLRAITDLLALEEPEAGPPGGRR